MKLETYLNAYIKAVRRTELFPVQQFPNAQRQHAAFRARILRMFEELESLYQVQYDALEIAHQNGLSLSKRIAEKEAEILRLKRGVFDIVTENQNDTEI